MFSVIPGVFLLTYNSRQWDITWDKSRLALWDGKHRGNYTPSPLPKTDAERSLNEIADQKCSPSLDLPFKNQYFVHLRTKETLFKPIYYTDTLAMGGPRSKLQVTTLSEARCSQYYFPLILTLHPVAFGNFCPSWWKALTWLDKRSCPVWKAFRCFLQLFWGWESPSNFPTCHHLLWSQRFGGVARTTQYQDTEESQWMQGARTSHLKKYRVKCFVNKIFDSYYFVQIALF